MGLMRFATRRLCPPVTCAPGECFDERRLIWLEHAFVVRPESDDDGELRTVSPGWQRGSSNVGQSFAAGMTKDH